MAVLRHILQLSGDKSGVHCTKAYKVSISVKTTSLVAYMPVEELKVACLIRFCKVSFTTDLNLNYFESKSETFFLSSSIMFLVVLKWPKNVSLE